MRIIVGAVIGFILATLIGALVLSESESAGPLAGIVVLGGTVLGGWLGSRQP